MVYEVKFKDISAAVYVAHALKCYYRRHNSQEMAKVKLDRRQSKVTAPNSSKSLVERVTTKSRMKFEGKFI